jgi:hypothetical protein
MNLREVVKGFQMPPAKRTSRGWKEMPHSVLPGAADNRRIGSNMD